MRKELYITKLLGSNNKLYVASEDFELIKRMQYDDNKIHTIEISESPNREDEK